MSHERREHSTTRGRRIAAGFVLALLVAGGAVYNAWQDQASNPPETSQVEQGQNPKGENLASAALARLAIKGRAPKTGYSREQFGGEWADEGSCTMRDKILARDLTHVSYESGDDCTVMTGTLHDPYTNKDIQFVRGPGTSSAIQIDHVVAISNAWQTGAQQLSEAQRRQLYNDPLELVAVDGTANQEKGDGDAATWLPPNKSYRCQYVARQIAVKAKYDLWVTQAEHDAMARVLDSCPSQVLPVELPTT